jgi:basic membrane protein A
MIQSALARGIGVAFAAALLAGCARREPVAPSRFTVRLITSATVSGPWERAAERGLGRIAVELDADVRRQRVLDTGDARVQLAAVGSAGVDLVFCVGSGLETAVLTEAALFPGTAYILLPGRASRANVASIRFMSEGAGYLAGAVAASLTSRNRVGVVRGIGGPWIEALEAGFAAGFRSRNDRGVVEPVAGVIGVRTLGESGVEVALYTTERARPDELDAAADAGILLVVTAPELITNARQVVVAAVEMDVPEAMARLAREVRDETFVGRVFSFDIGSGVLDVRINEALAPEVVQTAREALEAARAEVTAGVFEIEGMGL